jgi:hypothetical protein
VDDTGLPRADHCGRAVLFFEKLRQNDTRVIEQNLSAIANLKSDQINGWLSRNGTNIEVVATSSLIAERVGKWLSHGALPGAEKQKLRNRLEFMRKHFFYRELALLDTVSVIRPWLAVFCV